MNSGIKRFYITSLLILFVVATAIRVAPFFMSTDRLKSQYIIDDGYYMLTIARNIALGNGFSISDGLVPTNGTQPLGTLLYAAGFIAVQGDKFQGITFALAIQIIISLLAAVLIFLGAKKYFYNKTLHPSLHLAVAVLWYASPTTVSHTQNGLETALATLMIVTCLIAYDAISSRLKTGLWPISCIFLGFLLGISFLVRNDSCFLILAVLGVHSLLAWRNKNLTRGIAQNLIVAGVSFIVALPWLWFNVSKFGHPVPVSGRAESYEAFWGSNFYYSLVAFLENISLVFRIPLSMEGNRNIQLASGIILLALLILAAIYHRWLTEKFSAGVAILACFVGFLFIYYSMFFEMATFLGRYFFPAVLLSALIAVPVAAAVFKRIYALQPIGATVVVLAGVFLTVMCVGLNVRTFSRPANLQMQLVRWVEANVPEGTWVGAVQSGTLGYFYDYSINLDGKVDPQAFKARMASQIPQYLLKRNVKYLVDWVGITEWANKPEFAKYYELVLADPDLNLGVLKFKSDSLASK